MLIFNSKSNFCYQNKYFFEKAEALLNFYKDEDDEYYFEEKPNGTGYTKLVKNKIEFKIELYCNENHKWIIKTNFDNEIKEFEQHYIDDDYDIIQIHKELMWRIKDVL